MNGSADDLWRSSEIGWSRIACRYVYSATPRDVATDDAEVTEVQVQV